MPDPVRMKVYGLFTMTRSTYVKVQWVGAGLVVLWGLWSLFGPRPAPTVPGTPPSYLGILLTLFLDMGWWVAPLVMALESLETWYVLRAFTRQEALQTGPATRTSAP